MRSSISFFSARAILSKTAYSLDRYKSAHASSKRCIWLAFMTSLFYTKLLSQPRVQLSSTVFFIDCIFLIFAVNDLSRKFKSLTRLLKWCGNIDFLFKEYTSLIQWNCSKMGVSGRKDMIERDHLSFSLLTILFLFPSVIYVHFHSLQSVFHSQSDLSLYTSFMPKIRCGINRALYGIAKSILLPDQ